MQVLSVVRESAMAVTTSTLVSAQMHFCVLKRPTVAYLSCTGTGLYIAIATVHIGFFQTL